MSNIDKIAIYDMSNTVDQITLYDKGLKHSPKEQLTRIIDRLVCCAQYVKEHTGRRPTQMWIGNDIAQRLIELGLIPRYKKPWKRKERAWCFGRFHGITIWNAFYE